MEPKQFATVSWDYQDVDFVAEEEVGYEEAEQFLKDNEQKIIQYLCRYRSVTYWSGLRNSADAYIK